jgi:hypothetical protein
VTEPPAEILRRLRPIPASVGRPTTRSADVRGVGTDGLFAHVRVEGERQPVLLLFLSSECLGCRDLWEGLGELYDGLAGVARLAVVTRGPDVEDAQAIVQLSGAVGAERLVPLVMSSDAYAHYRVTGPPFLVVAGGDVVHVESVAWGVAQTLRTALAGWNSAPPPRP